MTRQQALSAINQLEDRTSYLYHVIFAGRFPADILGMTSRLRADLASIEELCVSLEDGELDPHVIGGLDPLTVLSVVP